MVVDGSGGLDDDRSRPGSCVVYNRVETVVVVSSVLNGSDGAISLVE